MTTETHNQPTRFFKNILVLAGGTALSQGLLVIATPLLTRLYTPEEFGFLAILISFLSISLTIVSLRYEMAIPLAQDENSATNLLGLSLALVSIISLLGLLMMKYFQDNIAKWLNTPDFGYYILWFYLSLMGAGCYQALKYWCSSRQLFHLISKTQIYQSITQITLQIGLGYLKLGSIGLIAGFALAQWVGLLTLSKPLKPYFAILNPHSWGNLAKTYHYFPLYTIGAGLINVLGWQIPPLLFAIYFSGEIVGWYALTIRVLGMPSALIGQAAAQVFYPIAARVEDPKILVEKVTCTLFIISLVIFIFIFIHSRMLFTWLFGQNWQMAGHYATWLAPWFMLHFVSFPLSSLSLVKSRQQQALWFTIYEIILRVAAIGTGIYYNSPALAIQLFSAAGVIISAVYITWALHIAGSSVWKIMIQLKMILLVSIFVSAILIVLNTLISPLWSISISLTTLMALGIWSYQSLISYKNSF